MTEPLYFVHISDTHIGSTPDYSRHGHVALPCAEKVVEIINNLPSRPDFVIHTGDIVTNPDPTSYQLAAQTFARLNVPVYYVNGNHDSAPDIHHFLAMGEKIDLLPGRETLTYTFKIKGHRFLVLDGRGPDEIDPHGLLSDTQLTILDRELANSPSPLTVFTHFPAVPLNSPQMDRDMRLLNWQAFHDILRKGQSNLRAVFHGHVHQNMQTVRDGVLYVSVASTFAQFGAWPTDETTTFDYDHPPGYNFVHLLHNQMIVHQHTFPRP